jgi:uncharacterized protein (DUF1810 family)
MEPADPCRLERFVAAQDRNDTYERAVAELRDGEKRSHWMWFVFPQISGLGFSAMSREFSISGLDEARAYLRHPVLGPRLVQCARIVAATEGSTAADIFGGVDAMKLRSSMTLFRAAAAAENQPENGSPFADVLVKYFDGAEDDETRSLLGVLRRLEGCVFLLYAARSSSGATVLCVMSLPGRTSSLVKSFSRHSARLVAGAVVSVGALAASVTAAAVALPASAVTSASTHHTFTVRRIASGAKLRHMYQADGNGGYHTQSLSGPDDITLSGRDLFVTFQNGVGPQGQASTAGDLDSTIVEFTLRGGEVRQWDLRGKCDGLTADPLTGQVIATVNEDAHSSLYTIAPRSGRVTHYAYNEPLPHDGGTDAIEIYHGQIVISASAPGTTGKAAPQPSYPAVYVVRLSARTRVATVAALFYDESTAAAINGPLAGKKVRLALTDPDSNEVVPSRWPHDAGDFMLASQGDEELIFDHVTGRWHQSLSVLKLTASVDDTAWATKRSGVLYATDNSGDTVDAVTGPFIPGTTFDAVTPCDENGAPATCPAPGYPPNYLATTNLATGKLTQVSPNGPTLQPQGMIFVP